MRKCVKIFYNMIPKIIHYCWFGGKEKPESALKCIKSWKKFFPDYEIKEWNESNFDVNMIPYTKAAYEAKKYAFVSDFARFWVLYHHGGVYFDTDVEVIRNMDDLLAKGSFMGCEVDNIENYSVAPGLGLAVEPQHSLYKEIIEQYLKLPFYIENHQINPFAVVRLTTQILIDHGLVKQQGIQHIEGITIYPPDYFNPWDDALGKLNKTSNTRSIHWYSKTWMKPEHPLVTFFKRLIRRVFGRDIFTKLRNRKTGK